MTELINISSVNGIIRNGLLIVIFALVGLISYYLINIGNRYVERSKRITINERLVRNVLIGLFVFALTVFIISKNPIISTVITCAIISVVLAYIINPLVDRLEKKGIKRVFGVAIVYISIILVLSILIVVVVPKTGNELRNLANELPVIADNIGVNIDNLLENLNEMSTSPDENTAITQISNMFDQAINEIMNSLQEFARNAASQAAKIMTNIVSNTIGFMVSFMLVIIMTFYFLVDKNLYTSKIRSFMPRFLGDDIKGLGSEINEVLYEFIRGRAILALFVGVLTTILLLIIKVDFAIVIGIITIIADIIPYVGPLLGFIPAFLFALIESPMKALIVAVFYVLIQWAENNILAPKIIGESMGLHPLFIFLSIVIGGGIFGVWGMVVSVPIAAIGWILIKFAIQKYKERKELEASAKKA